MNVKSKYWVLAVLSLLLSNSAMAQFFFYPIYIPRSAPPQVNGMTYSASEKKMTTNSLSKKNTLEWGYDSLDFNRLHGVKRNSDSSAYDIHYYAYPTPVCEKIGNTKYHYFKNKSYISTLESWVDERAATPALKKLCQTNFNIWEMCSRQAVIDFSTNSDENLVDLYNYYTTSYRKMANALEDSTQYGADTQKLNEISAKVRHGLENMDYDPESTVADLEDGSGCMMSAGLEAHFPSTDYIDNGYGFNFSLGFINRKHLFGVEGDFEFGSKCKKTISTSLGNIHIDDNVTAWGVGFFYGHRTRCNKGVRFTPFVNAGARFYGGQSSLHDDKRPSISGFSLSFGVMTDFVVSRSIDIRVTNADAIISNTNSIRLKPYFSYTNYGRELGKVCSVNVAIEFCNNAIKLRKRK